MDTPITNLIIGQPAQGGYFGGIIMHNNQPHGIAWAPKGVGTRSGVWLPTRKDVPGASSYTDGLANTRAMAEAGSELAQWALALRIGEFEDWSLPARDVLEAGYFHLKPSSRENWAGFRDGDNPSAIPPRYPYTKDYPVMTALDDFRESGAQAFDEEIYWSSTQYSAHYAWIQNFSGGNQDYDGKDDSWQARAVRLFALIG